MPDRREMMVAMRERMQANYRQQAKQQKSDDIIEFIKSNWKFFVSRRGEMTTAVQSLGTSGQPYSVDGLCDVLGVPTNVLFKRSPVKDIGAAMLDFPNSQLWKLFMKCSEAVGSEICLFIVAGTKSICITDMQTRMEPGTMLIHFVPAIESVQDIHIFKAKEAPERLPNLFNHQEDNYE